MLSFALGVLIPNSLGDSGEKQGKTEEDEGGTWILICDPNTTSFLLCFCVAVVVDDGLLLLLVVVVLMMVLLWVFSRVSSTRARPMPLVLLGCSHGGLVLGKFVGVLGVILLSTQMEFSAENGLVSRIEVGLMVDDDDSVCGSEVGEQIDRNPLKILGEVKKNEVGFVGLTSSHGWLLGSATMACCCLLGTGLDLFLSISLVPRSNLWKLRRN